MATQPTQTQTQQTTNNKQQTTNNKQQTTNKTTNNKHKTAKMSSPTSMETETKSASTNQPQETASSLYQAFITDGQTMLNNMRAMKESQLWADLGSYAHSFKGAAQCIQATELAEALRRLELSAKNKDSSQIEACFQQCVTEFNATQKLLPSLMKQNLEQSKVQAQMQRFREQLQNRDQSQFTSVRAVIPPTIFSADVMIKQSLGGKAIAEILETFINKEVPNFMREAETAYQQCNWPKLYQEIVTFASILQFVTRPDAKIEVELQQLLAQHQAGSLPSEAIKKCFGVLLAKLKLLEHEMENFMKIQANG